MRRDGPLAASIAHWLDVAAGAERERQGSDAEQLPRSFVVVSPFARLAAVDVCWNVEACETQASDARARFSPPPKRA